MISMANDTNKVFRKAALDRLSSPEQLDKMIQIASPSLWVALVAAGLVVLCVLLWAIFGRLPQNVDISGIYMSDTGVKGAYVTYGGTVSELYVKNDQQVKAGDPLALIVNESGGVSVRQLESRLAAVKAVTLDSVGDKATSDNSQLLEYKMQYSQAGMTREQKEATLKALKEQLAKAQAETKKYQAQMKEAEDAYLESIGDDSANVANFNYQKSQNELSTAASQYESAAQAVQTLESAVEQAGQTAESQRQQYADYESQYAQAKEQYDAGGRQLAGYRQQYEQQKNALAAQGLSEAEISQALTALETQISGAEATLSQLNGQVASLQAGMEQAAAGVNAASGQQQEYESRLDQARAQLNDAQAAFDQAQAAFDQAQAAYGDVYTSQGNKSAEQTRLNTAFSEASSLYSNAFSTQKSIEQQIASMEVEAGLESDNETVNKDALGKKFQDTKDALIKDLEREIENAKNSGAEEEITAPVDGVVVDCSVEQGQLVGQGTTLVRIKASGDDDGQVVRCYIPITEGKKMEAGMSVVVTPSTVDEQEYGHMTGRIRSVGTYAVSQSQMLQVLGDETTVQSFQQQGPSVEVLIELDRDESTTSGYAWSNKKGRSVELDENTIVTGKVRVKEEAPISKLIPFLKSKLNAGPKQSDGQAQEGAAYE